MWSAFLSIILFDFAQLHSVNWLPTLVLLKKDTQMGEMPLSSALSMQEKNDAKKKGRFSCAADFPFQIFAICFDLNSWKAEVV